MTTIATTIPAIIELIDTPIKTPIVAPVVAAPVVAAPVDDNNAVLKKVSKPKPLAAKHMKNMVFGYWIALKMKGDGLITEDGYNTVMNDYLAAYGQVNVQTTHYEQFASDTKITTKELKKTIKDFHKPPKVKKEKVKKEPAAKKGRKAQDKGPKDDLMARIVAASLPPKETATETETEIKSVVETEIKTVVETATETETEIKPDAPKPKRKYTRKKKIDTATAVTTAATTTTTTTVTEDATVSVITSPPQLIRNEPEHICNCDELQEEEMEDTEVMLFTLPNGDKCYKDDQNNLYDFTTREPL